MPQTLFPDAIPKKKGRKLRPSVLPLPCHAFSRDHLLVDQLVSQILDLSAWVFSFQLLDRCPIPIVLEEQVEHVGDVISDF